MTAAELMRELEADPDFRARSAQQERERAEREAEFRRAADPVLRDLEAAGIETSDFGRFVNRPFPGVLEPSTFDEVAALPILTRWLPRIADTRVKETIVRHIKRKEAGPQAASLLLREFAVTQDEGLGWVIGDAIATVADRSHFDEILALAADKRHGHARSPLVGMLWRFKSDAADQVLTSSVANRDTAFDAMSAARRRFGNSAARELIAPLIDADDHRVREAAREQLKRIDRYLGRQAGSS